MTFARSILVTVILVLSQFALAQPDEIAELAKSPKYMEQDVKPTFHKVTAKQLQDGVKIVSGRSHALFGFNTPEVQAHFPKFDNNVYADIQFSEAALVDEQGNDVPYERENGFYTHDDVSSETRFADPDYESIVSFARARGTVRVRYPASMRTVSVKAGDKAALEKAGLEVDGPYVKIYERAEIPEAVSFSPIEPVRAYDSSGRRLERYSGWSSGGYDDAGSFRGVAFHGVPARLDVDVVESWIGVEFDYDLPPAPLIPDARAGQKPKVDRIVDTPGGSVTMREVRIIPPDVLGWYAGQSRESLEELLREYGYPAISEDALMGAAARGEIEALRIVLASGISPDAGAEDGMTALISAAAVGQNEAAMLLIRAGANVNAVDQNNSSALLWATHRCDNADLLRALIRAGADVNVQARGTATPMMMATVMKCEENQKILKAAGAKEWKAGQ